MQKSMFHQSTAHHFNKKLILVIEQDRALGTQIVQKIRQGQAFQAILATSLAEARAILSFLKCDFLLLADDTFPENNVERRYPFSANVKPPTLLNLPPLLAIRKS